MANRRHTEERRNSRRLSQYLHLLEATEASVSRVVANAKRLSSHLKQGGSSVPTPRPNNSPSLYQATLPSEATPAIPSPEDVINILYPAHRPHDSPDLRHRGDLSHPRGPSVLSHRLSHSRSRSGSFAFSQRTFDELDLPPRSSRRHSAGHHHSSLVQTPDSLTTATDIIGTSSATSLTAVEEPPLIERTSGVQNLRTSSVHGSWDNLLRAAAARIAPLSVGHPLSPESIARADMTFMLSDIPVASSAHRRASITDIDQFPSVDPPPPYARTGGQDAPPMYDHDQARDRLA